MTPADLALQHAVQQRHGCADCDVTFPVRVQCVPRPDGLYDVVTSPDVLAVWSHNTTAHPVPPRLRRVS